VPVNKRRRAFLTAVVTAAAFVRHGMAQTEAERLVAAMQDGGKIIYWRYPPTGGLDRAREVGRAMYAMRVPLNDIVASPAMQARRIAEIAFGEDRLRTAAEIGPLLRTIPGPGMNRVIVGDRSALEMAAERRFSDAVLPEAAMAVFLPGPAPHLLGTISAERVIASAKARGAL